jgi:ComF family protein
MLPATCEICRDWTDQPLCAACVARFAQPQPRCACCGIRLGLPAPACGACLRDPPAFERTVCVADYGFPWDGLVTALKFQARPELATVLAPLLAQAVRATAGPLPDLVVPVPLAPQRLVERGYNQAWELARRVASALRLDASADLLLRPLDTAHQIGLNREQRQHNLRTAFMVEPRLRARLQGHRVALVDDVMTTAATAQHAAAALRRAGAAAVDVWVLARTPAH